MVRIVDHDERRADITKAAIEVIAEGGLEAAKMRAIAAHAGVTTGSLAHYFTDKESLLEATLQEVGRRLFREDASQKTGKKPNRFADILPTTPASRAYWKVWLAFCGQVAYSNKLQEIYRRFYLDIEVTVANDLNIADKKRAREIAASIIAAVDGVGLCATVQPELWPPARQKSRLKELLSPLILESQAN